MYIILTLILKNNNFLIQALKDNNNFVQYKEIEKFYSIDRKDTLSKSSI